MELALQLALCVPLQAGASPAAPERQHAALRAFALSRQVGTPRQMIQASYVLWSYFNVRAEFERAYEAAEQIIKIAQSEGDPVLAALGHAALGTTAHHLGDLDSSYHHLQQVLVHSDQRDYQDVVTITGWNLEVACMTHCALVLQAMGYPDQAMRCSLSALSLADGLGHPYSRAEALAGAALLHAARGEIEPSQDRVFTLLTLAEQNRFSFYQAWSDLAQAWQDLESGEPQRAITRLQACSKAFDSNGCETQRPLLLLWLASAFWQNGQTALALQESDRALECIRRTGGAF